MYIWNIFDDKNCALCCLGQIQVVKTPSTHLRQSPLSLSPFSPTRHYWGGIVTILSRVRLTRMTFQLLVADPSVPSLSYHTTSPFISTSFIWLPIIFCLPVEEEGGVIPASLLPDWDLTLCRPTPQTPLCPSKYFSYLGHSNREVWGHGLKIWTTLVFAGLQLQDLDPSAVGGLRPELLPSPLRKSMCVHCTGLKAFADATDAHMQRQTESEFQSVQCLNNTNWVLCSVVT